MKRLLKIFFITFFVTSLCISFATELDEDVVFLQSDDTLNLYLQESSDNSEKDIIPNTSYPNANMFESKAEQAFYKFVHNRMVNNRFSLFSMYLGEGQKAKTPQ